MYRMYLFIKSFKFRLFKVDFIGYIRASSVAQTVKNLPCSAGDPGSISGSEKFSGEGNGNPLQYYSCLKNHMDRGD